MTSVSPRSIDSSENYKDVYDCEQDQQYCSSFSQETDKVQKAFDIFLQNLTELSSESITFDDMKKHLNPFYEEDQEPASHYHLGGYHPVLMGEYMVDKRYYIIRKLGWDELSTQWLAKDIKVQTYVCIKIYKSSEAHTEQARILIRKVKEIQMQPNERIIKILDHFQIKGINGVHICIVTDIFTECLSNFMIRQNFQPIPLNLVKIIIRQVLEGLYFLHNNHLFHTNITPESILIKTNKQYQLELVQTTYQILYKMKSLPRSYKCNLPERFKHIETNFTLKYSQILKEWLEIDQDLLEIIKNKNPEVKYEVSNKKKGQTKALLRYIKEECSKHKNTKYNIVSLVKEMISSKLSHIIHDHEPKDQNNSNIEREGFQTSYSTTPSDKVGHEKKPSEKSLLDLKPYRRSSIDSLVEYLTYRNDSSLPKPKSCESCQSKDTVSSMASELIEEKQEKDKINEKNKTMEVQSEIQTIKDEDEMENKAEHVQVPTNESDNKSDKDQFENMITDEPETNSLETKELEKQNKLSMDKIRECSKQSSDLEKPTGCETLETYDIEGIGLKENKIDIDQYKEECITEQYGNNINDLYERNHLITDTETYICENENHDEVCNEFTTQNQITVFSPLFTRPLSHSKEHACNSESSNSSSFSDSMRSISNTSSDCKISRCSENCSQNKECSSCDHHYEQATDTSTEEPCVCHQGETPPESSCSTSTSTQVSYSEFLLSYCKHNSLCSAWTEHIGQAYYDEKDIQIVIADVENIRSECSDDDSEVEIQRQYKPIELILDRGDYNEKMDIWSGACLTFELVTGDFLFNPCESRYYTLDEHHILKMIKLMGEIPDNLYKNESCIRNIKTVLERDKEFIENINAKKNMLRIFSKTYKLDTKESKLLTKFLVPMLKLNPKNRATAEECLKSEWLYQ